MYNNRLEVRIKLIEFVDAMKISYPEDFCKQLREFRNRYPTMQQGLGFDLKQLVPEREFDQIDAAMTLGKIRATLLDPRNLMRIQGIWNENKSREGFPNLK